MGSPKEVAKLGTKSGYGFDAQEINIPQRCSQQEEGEHTGLDKDR